MSKQKSRVVVVDETDFRLREKVYQLRYQVTVDELNLNLGSDDNLLKDEYDDNRSTLLCVLSGEDEQVIATVRIIWGKYGITERYRKAFSLDRFNIIPEQSICFCSRLVVIPDRRGSLALGLLIRKMFQLEIEENIKLTFCDAKPALYPFYKRLGFRSYGECRRLPDYGDQQPMVILNEDKDYLLKINPTFFSKLAKEVKHDTTIGAWFIKHFPESIGR